MKSGRAGAGRVAMLAGLRGSYANLSSGLAMEPGRAGAGRVAMFALAPGADADLSTRLAVKPTRTVEARRAGLTSVAGVGVTSLDAGVAGEAAVARRDGSAEPSRLSFGDPGKRRPTRPAAR